jgi:hypothetical protein
MIVVMLNICTLAVEMMGVFSAATPLTPMNATQWTVINGTSMGYAWVSTPDPSSDVGDVRTGLGYLLNIFAKVFISFPLFLDSVSFVPDWVAMALKSMFALVQGIFIIEMITGRDIMGSN